MNLDDIPSGSLCVLDTNILIYAEQRASLQAERLMRRIEEQDVTGVLPQPVWQPVQGREPRCGAGGSELERRCDGPRRER